MLVHIYIHLYLLLYKKEGHFNNKHYIEALCTIMEVLFTCTLFLPVVMACSIMDTRARVSMVP